MFIVEQRCPYADADGMDAAALHLFCRDDAAAAAALACARVFAPGVMAPEAVIGRVATASRVRRTGLGQELMRRAIALVAQQHGPVPIRVGAQAYLHRFYASFGFVRAGDDYLEDGIPHLPMVRSA